VHEEVAVTPAGPVWVDRYPTSRSVDDLVSPFREGVIAFLADLDARGCTVTITSTRRPAERAWLMRHAWDVAHGFDPGAVPTRSGIDILWTLDGARAMVAAYRLAYRPSLTSRHIDGRAIDMTIRGWTGTNAELWALGAQYGVVKLQSDPPHWSDDGR
jgi:hypothetical protein